MYMSMSDSHPLLQITSSLGFFQLTGLIHNILIIQNNRDKEKGLYETKIRIIKITIETQFCHFLRHIFKTKSIIGRSIKFGL